MDTEDLRNRSGRAGTACPPCLVISTTPSIFFYPRRHLRRRPGSPMPRVTERLHRGPSLPCPAVEQNTSAKASLLMSTVIIIISSRLHQSLFHAAAVPLLHPLLLHRCPAAGSGPDDEEDGGVCVVPYCPVWIHPSKYLETTIHVGVNFNHDSARLPLKTLDQPAPPTIARGREFVPPHRPPRARGIKSPTWKTGVRICQFRCAVCVGLGQVGPASGPDRSRSLGR